MKPVAILVVLMGTLLIGMAMIVGAPPHIEAPVRFMLGAGLLGAMAVMLGGPIGKAIGAQLTGGAINGATEAKILAQLDELSQDMQGLRDDLAQMNERMDFAERLLTQRVEAARLMPGETDPR